MADIAKSGIPSICSVGPQAANRLSGLKAGEDIAAGDACYIKAADGKVWRATGAAANAAAKVRGYACEAAKAGQAVTLAHSVMWRYGAGLTPGTPIFLSATAGAIADAATTGGTGEIGFVWDSTRVFLRQSAY